jgi:hypothetical protein
MIGLLLRSPWAWGAIVVLLLASHGGVALWVQTAVNQTWELREQRAKAAHERALRIEQAKQKELGDRWAEQVDKVRGERDDARATIEQRDAALAAATRRIADLSRGNDRLRDELEQFARGGPAGTDTVAACQGRAQALAAYSADVAEAAERVVGRTVAVAETARLAAKERDEFAADIIACVAGWPKAPSVTGPGDDG